MNALSNVFSVLNLDGEEDKQQIASITDAKNEDRKHITAITVAKGGGSRKKNGGVLKNGGVSAKGGIPKDDKSVLGEYKRPLVWIDLEMTGLDIEVDRILEIACIITDGKLAKSVEGPDLVISQPKECLDNMGEWCRTHHAANGLIERVLQSTITKRAAEKQVIEFIKKHVGSDTPLLAGNSVYVDLLFLKAPSKEKNHRAMDDIRESIRELKYYEDNMFKAPGKSKR